MPRTREEFRFLRETVGMTREELAAILDVEPRAVKRWETHNDGGWYQIPQDAWDVLDDEREEQAVRVNAILDGLEASGEPVMLRYWLTVRDHDRLGGELPWRIENADTRLVAMELEHRGVEYGFLTM